MNEPLRLKDSPDVEPALRQDLLRVIAAPVAFDVDAAADRFDVLQSASSGGTSTATLGWAATGLATAIGGIVLAVSLRTPDQHAPDPVQPPPSAIVADDAVMPEPLPPEPTTEPVVEPEPAPIAPRAAKPARPRTGSVAPATAPSQSSLEAEMRATAQARDLLARDPARALKVARAAERRFSGGVFAEERQATIVLALHAIGRDEEARRRAAAFLARYPNGPFAGRVRAVANTK